MNFKEFFLEQDALGFKSPRHHSIKRLTSIGDGGITKDGSVKPIKFIDDVHKKRKDQNIEDAKRGKKKFISNQDAAKYAQMAGSELKNVPHEGLGLNSNLNSKDGQKIRLYYCPIAKKYYLQ